MKKYAYILSIMIVLISTKNIFAKSINLKTECKNIKENVECKILIDSNNKIIKGISYNYKNSEDITSFTANNIWSLNKSDNNGILLATKKDNSDKELLVGNIILSDRNMKSIELNKLDIVYKCKDKYCDYIKDKLTLELVFDENVKSCLNNTNLLFLSLILIIGIIIILIIKHKNKEEVTEII